MKWQISTLSGVVLAASFHSGIAQEPAPFSLQEAQEFLNTAAEEARQPYENMTFEQFRDSDAVFKEPFEGGMYIVNGDTPISSEAELREFYETYILRSPIPRARFTVHQVNGQDAVWDAATKRSLTYCVSNSFGNNYNMVVTAMTDAAGAWEGAADLDLIHVSQEDGNCTATNANVMFDVRPVNFGQYLARAFFPDDIRAQRNVLIDDSSFGLDPNENLTLTGILRHELGHTIGARHEHTRPESGTCFEDNDWRGVTDYDAFSVMHYPQCNGQGDWSLTLTAIDQNGVACLYGPAAGFTIDPTICTPSVTMSFADIVWMHRSGQVHYWPIANGQRIDGINIDAPVAGEWHLEAVGDVDGDGTDDIVWQHRLGQVHYWSIINGQRTAGVDIYVPVAGDWRLKAVGDVNGDGTDDIIWQHRQGQVHYWPMANGQRTDGLDIYAPIDGDWSLQGAGDVNGDGTDDIVWQHRSGQVHYWPMLNGQRAGGVDIYVPVGGDWSLDGVGDLNGDGTDDIVWQHRTGQVHYWPMLNGQRLGGTDIYVPIDGDWTLAGAGDLD